MADIAVELRWGGEGLVFEGGSPGGVPVTVDGNGKVGISPMQALLVSLAGCTAADVVDILTKMRLPLTALSVWVEGDRAAEPPRKYTSVQVVYEIAGPGADDREKVQRAIDLSHDKYCSVLHSLRPDLTIESELVLQAG